jgi:hypothetical protein
MPECWFMGKKALTCIEVMICSSNIVQGFIKTYHLHPQWQIINKVKNRYKKTVSLPAALKKEPIRSSNTSVVHRTQ